MPLVKMMAIPSQNLSTMDLTFRESGANVSSGNNRSTLERQLP